MGNALRGLVLGLLVALGACGGGGDAQVTDAAQPANGQPPPQPIGCDTQPRPVQCL